MQSIESKDDKNPEQVPLIHQHKLSWVDDPAHASAVGFCYIVLIILVTYVIPFFLGHSLNNFGWLAMVPIFVVNGLLAAKFVHFIFGDDKKQELQRSFCTSAYCATAFFFIMFTLIAVGGMIGGLLTSSYSEESERILEGKFLSGLCPTVNPATLDAATQADTVTAAEWVPDSSVYNDTAPGNYTWTTQGDILGVFGSNNLHWCLTAAPVMAPYEGSGNTSNGCRAVQGTTQDPLSVSFWAIAVGQIDGNSNPSDNPFGNATSCQTPAYAKGAIVKDSRNMVSMRFKTLFAGNNEFKNAADAAKASFLNDPTFVDASNSKYVVMTDTPLEDAEEDSNLWLVVFFSGLGSYMLVGLCFMAFISCRDHKAEQK